MNMQRICTARWRLASGLALGIAIVFAQVAHAERTAAATTAQPARAETTAADAPALDQPVALARYYFVDHLDRKPSSRVMEALARHYFAGDTRDTPPPALIAAMGDYFLVEHPELAPPAGLVEALHAHRHDPAMVERASPELRARLAEFDAPRETAAREPASMGGMDSAPDEAVIVVPDEASPIEAVEAAPAEAAPVEAAPVEAAPVETPADMAMPPPESAPPPEPDATTEAAAPDSAASPAVRDTPIARSRLSSDVIRPDEEVNLVAGVSFRLTDEQLRQVLERLQADLPSAGHPVDSTQSVLLTDQFHYAKLQARLRCPDFLECSADESPQKLNTQLMFWRWTIKASDPQHSQSANLDIDIYGYRNADDRDDQAEKIVAVPAMNVSLQVDCGVACAGEKIDAWGELFGKAAKAVGSLQGLLAAAAALVVLVLGWFRRKARAKAREDSVAEA